MSLRLVLNRSYLSSCVRNQNYLRVNPFVCKTIALRLFSSKPKSTDFTHKKVGDPENGELGISVMVKDQTGKILGVKTMPEAQQLAKKLSMFLIQENDLSQHKYKVFKLVSTKQLTQDNTVDEKETNSDINQNDDKKSRVKKSREVKRVGFASKLNENDLIVKIKQTKRWLAKDCEIRVHINSRENDGKLLENIYMRFEQELKSFAKFTHKKLSSSELKFNLLPIIESKDDLINEHKNTKHNQTDIDFENLDPNKLLSDEFEDMLKKK